MGGGGERGDGEPQNFNFLLLLLSYNFFLVKSIFFSLVKFQLLRNNSRLWIIWSSVHLSKELRYSTQITLGDFSPRMKQHGAYCHLCNNLNSTVSKEIKLDIKPLHMAL